MAHNGIGIRTVVATVVLTAMFASGITIVIISSFVRLTSSCCEIA
jgi:hypothetical protein